MTQATTEKKPAPIVPPNVVDAIVQGRLDDPFHWLGMHQTERGLRIVAFDPGASAAMVTDEDGGFVAHLKKIHIGGVFAAFLPEHKERFPYRLAYSAAGRDWSTRDTYSFGPILGDLDMYLIAEGEHREIWTRMGAHPIKHEGVDGTSFVVWAPNARRVSVIGDFNFWDGRRHVMRRRHAAGVWEIFIPDIGPGTNYKFDILGSSGEPLPQKADPFAFGQENPPRTASIVTELGDPVPEPSWAKDNPDWQSRTAPISIYEVHLGSWRRGEGDSILSYDDLADQLVNYAKDMGFTHLEFLPVAEHPFTGSWGYQPISLYAPTARYGDPEGFKRLVQACHDAGLGVIVDWVPAHFPSDAHGLGHFDGSRLYEHEDPRLGFHKDWQTLIYNFGRREVANFLLANALFWLEHYGIDGLRVDAVASMVYLDYSREEGEWIPNIYGGRENLEAVDLLQRVNTLIGERFPGRTTMAEESTAWTGVSHPVSMGGLGFHFKWNMGWMHDTLNYMSKDPAYRRYHHHDMTFAVLYAWTENFVLPLSHDEVVHGKGSLLGRMPGDWWQKFANLRAYFGYMWTFPGKKLLFMGGEFGQSNEWDHDRSLDWHLLEYPEHSGMQRLVRDLNMLYKAEPSLHRSDCDPAGFSWIEVNDFDQSIFSYERRDAHGRPLVIVANFTPVVRHDYVIGMPQEGIWHERLNTDADIYGGSNIGNAGRVEAIPMPMHGRPASASLTLPPLATIVLAPGEA